jgi:hypothetical protein
LLKGDLGDIHSDAVFRKAKTDAHRKLHDDVGLDDFNALRKKFSTQIIKNRPIKHYIQHFGEPYHCVMYSKEQALILSTLSSRYLYFDSTGSVCGTMGLENSIYYYSLVFEFRGKVVPVLQFFSTKHDNVTIGNVLRDFKRDICIKWETPNLSPIMHGVTIDHSWALLKAVLSALNNQTVSAYLQKCYAHVAKSGDWDTTHTRVHWCFAHLSKNVAKLCDTIICNRPTKKLV